MKHFFQKSYWSVLMKHFLKFIFRVFSGFSIYLLIAILMEIFLCALLYNLHTHTHTHTLWALVPQSFQVTAVIAINWLRTEAIHRVWLQSEEFLVANWHHAIAILQPLQIDGKTLVERIIMYFIYIAVGNCMHCNKYIHCQYIYI